MTACRQNSADRTRAHAQASTILEMLATGGAQGFTNSQLWAVCHAVNSRISDLRKRGHKIQATAGGGGIWLYRLVVDSDTASRRGQFEPSRQRELEGEAPLFAHAEVSP
jgi:hypothetical protein